MTARVLIVETERAVASAVAALLRELGLAVAGLASSSEDALSMVLGQRPDLVVIDVRPQAEMAGFDTATKIRERENVPFVFLTSRVDEAMLARMSRFEAYACPLEPLESRSFAIAVHTALQRQRTTQALADAERAKQRADARYRAVLENTHDAIISVDARCRIELFNKGAERVFGFSPLEVMGEPLDLLLPEVVARAHRAHFAAFQTSGTTFRPMGKRREVVGRRRSGAEFPAEVTISRLSFDEEEIFTACVRDISERRVLEEQFIRAQKMEAVGRVAASVAHDFNNLLTGLQANAYVLMQGVSLEMQERVQEIGSAVERGVALTRQLIGFSRQERSHRTRLAVNELVAQAVRLLEHMVGSDVRLRSELDPAAGHVIVEGNLIEQVLMNLVINARDALPQGGDVVIRTDVLSLTGDDSLPAGRYVRLSVTDTGGGIPSELQAKVFEPFFTTKAPGLG
ncbi:MAG TPA: PAS domain S-box protein, partial [Polyangiaceae bacterium]|nr:PAS domain S-box protein [Polyangiaceae bacterium]